MYETLSEMFGPAYASLFTGFAGGGNDPNGVSIQPSAVSNTDPNAISITPSFVASNDPNGSSYPMLPSGNVSDTEPNMVDINALKSSISNVGDFYGDGRTWYKQAQPNNGPGAYVLWTDDGKVNRNYDAQGNFLGEYAGAEDFGMKDLLAGGLTILGGMGLGNMLSSAIAGGSSGAAAGATGGWESGTLSNGVTVGGPMSTGLPIGTSLPSMGAMSGVGAAAGAAGGGGAAAGGLLSNPLLKGALGAVTGVMGGGSSGGGLGGLGGILSGLYDYNQQTKASESMLEWLKSQQAKIDSIYDPQGERAKFMWEEMSRKDAAAGRNSQYGPRSTDFLGKFGGEYAGHTANLARGLAGNFSDALNQKASAGSGLAAGAGNFLGGGLNSIVQNLSSALGSNTPNWATGTGQYAQFTNDDYGQFF